MDAYEGEYLYPLDIVPGISRPLSEFIGKTEIN